MSSCVSEVALQREVEWVLDDSIAVWILTWSLDLLYACSAHVMCRR
jgi:hypothetical protein